MSETDPPIKGWSVSDSVSALYYFFVILLGQIKKLMALY